MKLRNYVLLGAASLSLGTAAVVAQPTSASAKTAIPAKFRHTWEGHGYGNKFILKVYKYHVNFDQKSQGKNYWQKRYYKKLTKNHYAILKHNEEPNTLEYHSSHMIYMIYDVQRVHMYRVK
ncbi:MAG TPA: hypothetical protein DDW71_10990 [Lactobacillus sp.]|mgnify:CR=1 FL=1|nr:hypothetical protein [Lactobacillus sp.]